MIFKTNENNTYRLLNFVNEKILAPLNKELDEDMVAGLSITYECFPKNGLIGIGLFNSNEEEVYDAYTQKTKELGLYEYLNKYTIDLFYILHEVGHIATNHYHSEYIHNKYTPEYLDNLDLDKYMETPKEHWATMWAIDWLNKNGSGNVMELGCNIQLLRDDVIDTLEVLEG